MTIACISIQRFAVEAERHRRKSTNARLLLVGENTVYDCSLGAEVLNVSRGMRMSEAIGLCPNAIVVATDRPYYERLFKEILDYLESFSPVVQAAGIGTANLAVDGLPTPPHRLAEEIISGVHARFGFMASAGIADGKFGAEVAAKTARPGTVKSVAAGEVEAFLGPLPIEHLPASEAMRWRLAMLGLTTIGDVARLPLGAVQAQFGTEGKHCWELAQGLDLGQLQPRVSEATVVRRMQLPGPAMTIDAILMGIEKLVHATYAAAGSRWVRKAVVRAAFEDGGSWEVPVAFREALSDPRDAWFAIKNAVLRRPPEWPVEELEVELVHLGGESGKQATMFEGKGKLWRQVEEAVRQLDSQGDEESPAAIGKVISLAPRSRIPERRAALADFAES